MAAPILSCPLNRLPTRCVVARHAGRYIEATSRIFPKSETKGVKPHNVSAHVRVVAEQRQRARARCIATPSVSEAHHLGTTSEYTWCTKRSVCVPTTLARTCVVYCLAKRIKTLNVYWEAQARHFTLYSTEWNCTTLYGTAERCTAVCVCVCVSVCV